MLRVTTLYASSAAATAAYYTRYLSGAPSEEPGVWSGRQADEFGLAGRVGADQLEALLEGRDPTSGTPLGNPLRDRTLSSGRVLRAVAGFDATFSAPKSLSVWWALTGDRGLLDAHDGAVMAALGHLERFGATTRLRVDGRRLHPDTLGLNKDTVARALIRLRDARLVVAMTGRFEPSSYRLTIPAGVISFVVDTPHRRDGRPRYSSAPPAVQLALLEAD